MRKKKIEEFVSTGRRKTAVASVRMRKGSGKHEVNGKAFDEYFSSKLQRKAILAPLEQCSASDKYDLFIRLTGGGINAQGEAIRLGLSRALVQENEELRSSLKDLGFLRRDPRKKERKKYGLAGARKKYQFSKR
ncbi:MAG: 30S ribosomal protein S9 [Parachlamydiales bacterium]|nr:30S ribosomal protein S9 [Parachlamydiales bacterium]